MFKTDPFGNGFIGPLIIVYENRTIDAAILQIPRETPHWMRVGRADPEEGTKSASTATRGGVGQQARADGVCAWPARNGVGLRSRKQHSPHGDDLVSNPGNSGGPVFRIETGDAVAIHKAQLLNSAGQAIDGYSTSTLLTDLRQEFEKFGIVRAP